MMASVGTHCVLLAVWIVIAALGPECAFAGPSTNAVPEPPSNLRIGTAAPTPPSNPRPGIWISAAEVRRLPMSGTAWAKVQAAAEEALEPANVADQSSTHPVRTMAVALAYARTGMPAHRNKAAAAILSAIGTENNVDEECGDPAKGAQSLALGRNIAGYAISADLIDLSSHSAADHQRFSEWLLRLRTRINCDGRTLITCHETRPNNWGTMCGASRIAADLYLHDAGDLERAAKVLKGWMGDISSHALWSWYDWEAAASWMCDTEHPRPLNPVGCIKDGRDLSGAPVDDVRRGAAYDSGVWPPVETYYAWGGFSAAAAQAEMLHRSGYDAYQWESQALKRGQTFLSLAMPSSETNATHWLPWLINYRYGTSFPAVSTNTLARLVGWTDWTHGPGR